MNHQVLRIVPSQTMKVNIEHFYFKTVFAVTRTDDVFKEDEIFVQPWPWILEIKRAAREGRQQPGFHREPGSEVQEE